MNLKTKIFYLSYIIQFIDNEFLFYNTLKDTLCSESFNGRNSDFLLNIKSQCCQFILTKNDCYVYFFEKNKQEQVSNEIWIQSFIKANYTRVLYGEEDCVQQSIIRKCINDNEYTIFFVKKIFLEMKKEVFKKIKMQPSFCLKFYSSEEIFHIAYSYSFSVLDNRYAILENIINLIGQNLFNIDEINTIFMQHAYRKNNNNSKFSIKLKTYLYMNKVRSKFPTHQSKTIFDILDKFIEKNCDSVVENSFTREIFYWKNIFYNLFQSIRITFLLDIITKEKNSILTIRNVNKPPCLFTINIENFDHIDFFICSDSIFTIEIFKEELFTIFDLILDKNTELIIKIDISLFYFHLYSCELEYIKEQNIIFHNFILFILRKSNQLIEIYVGFYKFHILKHNTTNVYDIFIQKATNFEKIFKYLMISKKILLIGAYLKENIVQKIAIIIISFYIEKTNTEHTSISYLKDFEKISLVKSCKNSEKNSVISTCSFLKHNENYELQEKSITFDDNNQINGLIGIDDISHYFENIFLLEGVYDGNFACYKCDSILNRSNIFSVLISDSLSDQNNHLVEYNRKFRHESFVVKTTEENFLLFEIKFINDHHDLNEISINMQKNTSNDYNIFQGILKDLMTDIFELEDTNSEFIRWKFSIEHFNDEANTIISNHRAEKNPIADFTIKNDTKFKNDMRIMNSNFHIIILRLIECKSIQKDNSLVYIEFSEFKSSLSIENCEINFLYDNDDPFYIFKQMKIKYCILKSFHLNMNFTRKMRNYTSLKNSLKLTSVKIQNFIQIKELNETNQIYSIKKPHKWTVKIHDAKVDFFENIPDIKLIIYISNSEVFATKNTLISKHSFSHTNHFFSKLNYFDASYKSFSEIQLFLKNSILPDNFHITGIFHTIDISNCISTFFISAISEFVKILNHHGTFSIQNNIRKVVKTEYDNESICVKNSFYLLINNYDVEYLSDINVEQIFLENCKITKIQNLECKYLVIKNSLLSFPLKINGKIVHQYNEFMDYHKSNRIHFIIDAYNNED